MKKSELRQLIKEELTNFRKKHTIKSIKQALIDGGIDEKYVNHSRYQEIAIGVSIENDETGNYISIWNKASEKFPDSQIISILKNQGIKAFPYLWKGPISTANIIRVNQ